jgi:hypothetical protein
MPRYTPVVDCRSRTDLDGSQVWVARLQCGTVVEKLKRRAGGRAERAAPLRVRCRCRACLAGAARR